MLKAGIWSPARNALSKMEKNTFSIHTPEPLGKAKRELRSVRLMALRAGVPSVEGSIMALIAEASAAMKWIEEIKETFMSLGRINREGAWYFIPRPFFFFPPRFHSAIISKPEFSSQPN